MLTFVRSTTFCLFQVVYSYGYSEGVENLAWLGHGEWSGGSLAVDCATRRAV